MIFNTSSHFPYSPRFVGEAGRLALEPEIALAEIKRCSGTQFDPDAAAAFLRAYKPAE